MKSRYEQATGILMSKTPIALMVVFLSELKINLMSNPIKLNKFIKINIRVITMARGTIRNASLVRKSSMKIIDPIQNEIVARMKHFFKSILRDVMYLIVQ